MRRALPLLAALFLPILGHAQDSKIPVPIPAYPPGQPLRHGHDPTSGLRSPGHAHGAHGNPEDLARYIARMEEPARAAWQKPDEVVKALGLAPGQTVCDVGAGPGYFSLRLGRAVGPKGHVFAIDVEPRMTETLRDRLAATELRNVSPVLALPADPLLPDGACDLVLVVDSYHHFPDPPAYLARLARALKPGGRLVNVDFHKRPTPALGELVGPPVAHRVSREVFLSDAARAGLSVVSEPTFLPHQYMLIMAPRQAAPPNPR